MHVPLYADRMNHSCLFGSLTILCVFHSRYYTRDRRSDRPNIFLSGFDDELYSILVPLTVYIRNFTTLLHACDAKIHAAVRPRDPPFRPRIQDALSNEPQNSCHRRDVMINRFSATKGCDLICYFLNISSVFRETSIFRLK